MLLRITPIRPRMSAEKKLPKFHWSNFRYWPTYCVPNNPFDDNSNDTILFFLQLPISKVYTKTLFIYHKTPSVCFANCWWHHEVYFYKSPWSLFLNYTTIGKVLYIMSSGGLYEIKSKICADLALLGRLGFMSFFYILRTLDPNSNKLF